MSPIHPEDDGNVELTWHDQMSFEFALYSIPRSAFQSLAYFFDDMLRTLFLFASVLIIVFFYVIGQPLPRNLLYAYILSLVFSLLFISFFACVGCLLPPRVLFGKHRIVVMGGREDVIDSGDVAEIKFTEFSQFCLITISYHDEDKVANVSMNILRNESSAVKIDAIKTWCAKNSVCTEFL